MLSRALADRLSEATGIPQVDFGTLYRSGGDANGVGSMYYWKFRGRIIDFAPASVYLTNPKGFARKLGLVRSPDPAVWRELVADLISVAVVI